MGRNYAISYDIRIYANLPERHLSNASGRFLVQGRQIGKFLARQSSQTDARYSRKIS